MSFNIVDPNSVVLDSVTNIVIGYRGLAVGERVDPKVAAHKQAADGCWAGTRRSTITLRVRVDEFPGTSDLPPPVIGFRIRPYLVHTGRHIPVAGGRGFTRTFHGTIGNQDAYFCSK